jgi:hypothetical protein
MSSTYLNYIRFYLILLTSKSNTVGTAWSVENAKMLRMHAENVCIPAWVALSNLVSQM